MPRRLIDEIAGLEESTIPEEQVQEQSRQVKTELLHLELDIDAYIEALEKRRLEILSQIRKLLQELREINKKLERARMLRQLSALK